MLHLWRRLWPFALEPVVVSVVGVAEPDSVATADGGGVVDDVVVAYGVDVADAVAAATAVAPADAAAATGAAYTVGWCSRCWRHCRTPQCL